MDAQTSLQLFGLIPSDAALPQIRALLAAEVEAERTGLARAEDLALLCCVQLFSRGHLEDVLPIWEAKRASMDLGALLDVQLLCGAGLAPTKQFLATQQTEQADHALAYLEHCEAAGDLTDFSPIGHLQFYQRYFNLE